MQDNNSRIFPLLKTLNTSTEDSKTDFFSNDSFLGISEQDIQVAINQLQQKKSKEM